MSVEIYVDGRFQSLDRPAIPARDRGFLYGEAVYESILIDARRPLFLEAHLERLADSAAALDLDPAWEGGESRRALARLLDRAGLDDALARLFLTGASDPGETRRLAWVEPVPIRSRPDTPAWRLAVHPGRLLPYAPGVKHAGRLAHARARRTAIASGADDAVLVHPDGWVLEGTTSNLFFFEADTLHTPEPGCGILPGITRDVVLELAPGCGFRTVEGRYPVSVVEAAEECFLTFTSAGVKPVAAIGERVLPGPVPGPRTERIRSAYRERIEAELAGVEPLA